MNVQCYILQFVRNFKVKKQKDITADFFICVWGGLENKEKHINSEFKVIFTNSKFLENNLIVLKIIQFLQTF